ncbi:hypothetical protein CBL_08125 [Carabus blaptoides fortunei]
MEQSCSWYETPSGLVLGYKIWCSESIKKLLRDGTDRRPSTDDRSRVVSLALMVDHATAAKHSIALQYYYHVSEPRQCSALAGNVLQTYCALNSVYFRSV